MDKTTCKKPVISPVAGAFENPASDVLMVKSTEKQSTLTFHLASCISCENMLSALNICQWPGEAHNTKYFTWSKSQSYLYPGTASLLIIGNNDNHSKISSISTMHAFNLLEIHLIYSTADIQGLVNHLSCQNILYTGEKLFKWHRCGAWLWLQCTC